MIRGALPGGEVPKTMKVETMMGMGAVWALLALLVAYVMGSRAVASEAMRPIRALSERERRVLESARREMEVSEESLF